jgi:phosphoribosyl 1,2-cyclic phosphodiesterase
MRVHVLGSGSHGNSVLLESGDDRVLIDAGFAPRTLAARMRVLGIAPESVSALVITHEHWDHVCGAAASVRRWNWPVYASVGTTASLRRSRIARPTAVEPRRELAIGDLSLRFVRIPHDAADPVGVVATTASSGTRVGVVYDLGHVAPRLEAQFADLDLLLIESNHDDEMLRHGPYPLVVQRRIAGPQGHLSNVQAARLARRCVHRGLRHVILCHLSLHNNRPETALHAVRVALRGSGFRGTLQAASQTAPASVAVTRRGGQLSLAI